MQKTPYQADYTDLLFYIQNKNPYMNFQRSLYSADKVVKKSADIHSSSRFLYQR